MNSNLEHLRVTIDEKHKPSLTRRFDYSNRHKRFCRIAVRVRCSLCEEHIEVDCWGCPFHKFETEYKMGCQAWIRRALADLGHEKVLFSCYSIEQVEWKSEHDKKVQQQLSALRAAADELITWKENGKVKKGA